MKIKVGDTWYDGKNQPIMVVLSESDKINITNMIPSATKYCDYPDTGYPLDVIQKWMEVDDAQ